MHAVEDRDINHMFQQPGQKSVCLLYLRLTFDIARAAKIFQLTLPGIIISCFNVIG